MQGDVDVIDPRLKTTLRAEYGAQDRGVDAWIETWIWTRLDALKEVRWRGNKRCT